MGSEVQCRVRFGKQESRGKTLLETSEIIFRGGDFRLRIPFKDIRAAEVYGEELRLRTAEGEVHLEVGGKTAAKWREKILHPKSRLYKLGVKTDSRVTLIGFAAGEEDQDFLGELGKHTKNVVKDSITAKTEWIFLKAAALDDLARVARIRKRMRGAMALWIVFPKGQKGETKISESSVFSAGRSAGLTDVKVVGFSATHSSLKFVIPLSARE